jgi:short-subunit dehydrogenase
MEPDLFNPNVPAYKKAIVIGASSGIGRAVSRILVNKNYRVGITGRRENLLKELQQEDPEKYIYRVFDIRDMPKTSKNLNAIIKELGGLDLIVMSSGIGYINEELDLEPEFRTIETNVTAFTDIITFTYRYFQQQGRGHIVGITSIAALRGNPKAPGYNASKSYQMNYLEGLRIKSKKQKLPIIITDVRPGFVATDMAKGDTLFWVASPEKAAAQIYRAIKRKRKKVYITKRWRLYALFLKIYYFNR